jgi:phosphatidylinositol-3-phosphatase
VVMENTGLARAMRSRTISSLASRALSATSYHAVARPSLPNYLAMTSGSTWDIADNSYYSLPNTGLGAQLTAAGIPWRAYMEGMTKAGCMYSPYPYALKHDPFAYYGDGCPENVVPFESFDADLAGATPRFVWITPGLCHDGHDCPIDEAAAWLDGLVVKITASRAWAERGILLIAFDEGDGGDANLVPFIAMTSGGRTGEITTPHDHYSLLATIEDLFGLPRLGLAKDARPIAELLGTD